MFVVLLVFVSCKTTSNQEAFLRLFEKTISKETETFSINPEDIRQPVSLVVYQKWLVLYDYGVRDSLFSVYDIETGKHLLNFGSVGGGPNEFLQVANIRQGEHSLFAYDITAHKMFIITPDDDYFVPIKMNIIQVENDSILKLPMNAFPGGDTYNFVSGIIRKNRLCIVDLNGRTVTTIGSYPYDNKDVDLSFVTKAFLYQPRIAFNTKLNKLLIASPEGIQLDFYDLADIKTPMLLQKYHYLQPEFRIDSDESVTFSKENIPGIIQVEGASQGCYCLYADRKWSECVSGEDAYSANKILVFSWDGKPLKIISLDHRYGAMAINEANQEILLLGKDEQTKGYIVSRIKLQEEFE